MTQSDHDNAAKPSQTKRRLIPAMPCTGHELGEIDRCPRAPEGVSNATPKELCHDAGKKDVILVFGVATRCTQSIPWTVSILELDTGRETISD